MKALVILIVFLLVVVGLLGYMNYEQGNLVRQLQTAAVPVEFEFEWVEPIPLDRYIELDILGEIQFIPIDSEGRVKHSTVCSGGGE
ncbi:hypothetical protein ES707_21471 [subsurface metagenome]